MSRRSRNFALLSLFVLAAAGLAAGRAMQASGSGPRPGVHPPPPRAVTAVTARATPASFRFAPPAAEPAAEAAEAPLQLTASDGTGLSLVALEANGVLEPPLAFTELHLTFENPRDQRMEGRFRIVLPPGAALSRFAMKIGETWQEGEVVERQRARVAYEDFLHLRKDPALLEQEAGNEFSARVFPIPPRGRKELIVAYSHALARADEPYVIPLHGLAAIGRLDIRVQLGEHPVAGAPGETSSNLGGEVSDRRVVELHKQGWTPDRDFAIGQDRVAGRAGLRHGNLAVVRVTAPAPADIAAVPEEIAGLYVLVDSSASRALGYAAQVRRLAELIVGLRDGAGGATPLGVAAFDQEVVPIFEGRAGGFGAAEAEPLATRRPLGASDLHKALTWLAGRPLHLSLAGRPVPLGGLSGELATPERPLLERAWAQARIERLLHLRESALAGDDDLRRALGHEITELSVKHRVLSPFTAMLVLESASDYWRFGLDQRALADILTVGPGGLAVLARSRSALPPADRIAVQAKPVEPAGNAPDDFGDFDNFGPTGPRGVENGVPGGVEGGVAGGVAGGVVGGVPSGGYGGVPAAPRIPPPPAPAPAHPVTAAPEAAESAIMPLRATAESTDLQALADEKARQAAPYSGRFAKVVEHLAAGRVAPARPP